MEKKQKQKKKTQKKKTNKKTKVSPKKNKRVIDKVEIVEISTKDSRPRKRKRINYREDYTEEEESNYSEDTSDSFCPIVIPIECDDFSDYEKKSPVRTTKNLPKPIYKRKWSDSEEESTEYSDDEEDFYERYKPPPFKKKRQRRDLRY